MDYAPEHGAEIAVQLEQKAERIDFAELSKFGDIWTIVGDSHILAIAGLYFNHWGYYTGWAALAENLTMGEYGFVTQEVKRYLNSKWMRRVDMLVRTDYEAGHRWAKRLGFTEEGVLRARGVNGEDMTLYAIIKDYLR